MVWDKNAKKITDQLIFNTIRKLGPVSKKGLSEAVDASISTVSNAVESLVRSGKIKRTNIGNSSGGRKPILYRINGSAFIAVGVVINRETIKMVIIDLDASVLASEEHEMDADCTPIHFVTLLKAFIDRGVYDKIETKVLGIGMAIVGPIDHKNGIIMALLGHPSAGWMNASIRDLVIRETGMQVFLVNRAQAGALAEHWYGTTREVENIIFVYNRIGVGCGIVAHGRLLDSTNDMLSSLGHMAILSYEGNEESVIILNEVATKEAIIREAEKHLPQNTDSILFEASMGKENGLEYDQICTGAEQGDRFCVTLTSRAAKLFGLALANFINVLRPELVIVGGETVDRSPLFYDIAVSTAREMVYTVGASESVRFSKPSLGENAIEIGAATIVFSKILNIQV